MAVLIANKDGTSNAKAGDTVVTGGGIYKKNADGTSTKIGGLPTDSGTTKDYNVVQKVYDSLKSVSNSSSSSSNSTYSSREETTTTKTTTQPDLKVKDVDSNGIVTTEPMGYDPTDYEVYTTNSSSNSAGLNKIMGYVIFGLVGIALIDRFMNGGGGK